MNTCSRIVLLAAVLMLHAVFISRAQETFHPQADPAASIVQGNARFTVLTPRLIRMEWAEDGVFEDNATLAVVDRALPVPDFKVRKSAKSLTISTEAITLKYRGNSEFSAENLSVSFSFADASAKKGVRRQEWHPGMKETANLQGTTRTLDGFDNVKIKPNGYYTRDVFETGILSRDGWAILDESARHLLVPTGSDWKYWVQCRPAGKRIDWYIFAYGHDYTAALKDFTRIAGKIPLPPKYAFGYWWCRYWLYSDYELIDLARHFQELSIPADVMIIDMDWHETWGMGDRSKEEHDDYSGYYKGWTGYTWKKELFPNPANLLQELHGYKLKTSLNLHPASGIQCFEEPYERFVKDYLSRAGENHDPIDKYSPFHIDQEAWADAYFNSVLHPMEEMGVDFWWLDWQQKKTSNYTKKLSNTFWLNYTFWNDVARRGASQGADAPRPLIYHRWGGIGSHRYQVGFSGDTFASWDVLRGLPWFTSTASNVGYGYWGHDIGGHMQPAGVNETNPELYTRWLQNGVFMPIFKTHSTKNMSMEKRFWVFPDHFDAMKAAIRLRYDLSPYIYTAAREAYDSGVSICRPLYYTRPDDAESYDWKEEYMFGDDILATVVCRPADKETGLSERKMWFPRGNDWYDMASGRMYEGGTQATALYTIDENPWYVRAGAIIPLAGHCITNLQDPSDEIRFLLVPGKGEGSTVLYEDDGVSQAYPGSYATTEVRRETTGEGVRINVLPRKGSYKGMSDGRRVSFILDGASAPGKVTVNGKEIPYSRFAERDAKAGKEVWGYDGEELAVCIYLAERPAGEAISVECDSRFIFTEGQKALLKRMRRITPEAKLVFAYAINSNLQLTPELLRFAGTASFITEDPANAGKYLSELSVEALRADLDRYKDRLPAEFVNKLFAQIGN